VLFSIGLLGSLAWASSAREDSAERLQNAANVLNEIMSAPDKGIPEEVLDSAKCVLVIPHLVKGGFIIGGKHGRGVGSCRTNAGWSAPAFISVGGGSAGLQTGVEGVDLVMLVMNNNGLQHYEAPTRLESYAQLPFRKRGASGAVRFRDQRRTNSFAPQIARTNGCKRAIKIPSDGCSTT
jgi:hypothetical protein